MKKYLVIILALLVMMSIIACISGKSTAPSVEALGKGKTMVLKLESNPSTGYDWVYTLSEDKGSGEIALINQEYISSDPTGTLMGAGGYNIYVFEGTKKGPQTLTFTYKRNWEGGEVAYDVIYDLIVDDDSNILYIGKKKGIVESDKELSFFPDPAFE